MMRDLHAEFAKLNAQTKLRLELIDAARALRDERRDQFIGPKPPWWRPFARDAWHARVREAATMRVNEDDLYSAAFAMGNVEVFNVLDSVLAVIHRWDVDVRLGAIKRGH